MIASLAKASWAIAARGVGTARVTITATACGLLARILLKCFCVRSYVVQGAGSCSDLDFSTAWNRADVLRCRSQQHKAHKQTQQPPHPIHYRYHYERNNGYGKLEGSNNERAGEQKVSATGLLEK